MADETGLGTGGAVAGNENSGAEAFNFLPDGLQSLAEGYEKPEDFWARTSELHAQYREKSAIDGIKPESLVSEEDYAKVFKTLGKPEDKAGYKLPDAWSGTLWTPDGKGASQAPEALTGYVNDYLSKDADQFRDIADRCNLTQKQAETLWNLYGSVVARGFAQVADKPDTQAVFKEIFPQDTEKHFDAANRGATSLGIVDELNTQGLAANPLVLKLCHALGERISEDKVSMPGSAGISLPTGEAAREELYRVIGSDAYKNGDKTAQRMAAELSGRVHIK